MTFMLCGTASVPYFYNQYFFLYYTKYRIYFREFIVFYFNFYISKIITNENRN